MNLPLVSTSELLDQSLAPDQRGALWSQLVVRVIVEKTGESSWMPSPRREDLDRPGDQRLRERRRCDSATVVPEFPILA